MDSANMTSMAPAAKYIAIDMLEEFA